MLREKVDFINEMAQNIVKLNAYIFFGRVAEWQTHTTQNRTRKLMRVRLPPRPHKNTRLNGCFYVDNLGKVI